MASIGSQFSTGEQNDSVKEAFWRSGFAKCQNSSCPDASGNKTIKSEEHPAGCRMNGDGYGTTVFTCTSCGWTTSFQYDEASDPCYYETRNYRSETPTPLPPHPWGEVDVEDWLRGNKIDPRVMSKMRSYNLMHGPTIADMGERQLRALGFKEDEARDVAEVIRKKNNELNT